MMARTITWGTVLAAIAAALIYVSTSAGAFWRASTAVETAYRAKQATVVQSVTIAQLDGRVTAIKEASDRQMAMQNAQYHEITKALTCINDKLYILAKEK